MTKRFVGGLAVAALALSWSTAQAAETWRVTGGSTTVEFANGLLDDLGFQVVKASTSAQPRSDMPTGLGFALNDSTLMFNIHDHRFEQFQSGRILHKGGFSFQNGKRSIPLQGFSIEPKSALPQMGMSFQSGSKGQPITLDINHAKVYWDPAKQQLLIGYADLVITPEWARSIGRQDLAGQLIGQITVQADAKWNSGDPAKPFKGWGDPGPELDVPMDVSIVELYGLVSYGRLGTYPNGENGLSMATTSCNPGNVNIPWYQAMDERHPVIAMQMYRELNDRFEQIGESWLKHGFFALNNNQCGTCQNPGTGSLLGPNCSDTYSAGNNASQNWLGARNEVNPFTGLWTCTGSWFANYQPDCTRRNNGSGLTAIDHRLRVRDADLGNAGATYYYEAYYITREDVNKYNNVSSRKLNSTTWTGSQWTFSTSSEAMRPGPAITRYGDMNSIATPRTEGDVIVAVKTKDLGGGMWRYNYSMYVHDLDRQVRTFSVPIGDAASALNFGFHDIDTDSGNNWTAVRSGGMITWSTGTVGQTGANPLKYGNVYNVWFDSNAAPVDTSVVLGQFKPGSGGPLSAASKGPRATVEPTTLTLPTGTFVSGNVNSIKTSDNQYAVFQLNLAADEDGDQILAEVGGVSPLAAPGRLEFLVESTPQLPSTQQKIYLYDFVSATWVLKNTRILPAGDSAVSVVVTGPEAARYVQPGTRTIKARIGFNLLSSDEAAPWQVKVDQAVWIIN